MTQVTISHYYYYYYYYCYYYYQRCFEYTSCEYEYEYEYNITNSTVNVQKSCTDQGNFFVMQPKCLKYRPGLRLA